MTREEATRRNTMQNTEYHSLRKCPFCGAKVAYFGTVADIELMDDDYPDYELAKDHYAVVCNYNEGGCGATTRGYATAEEAIEAWNRRCGDV